MLRQDTTPAQGGFGIRPYESLPPLYVQALGSPDPENRNKDNGVVFTAAPDWYRNVVYFEEGERGFDDAEDLFMPGLLEISLPPLPKGGCVYVTAGTEPCLENLGEIWKAESLARVRAHKTGRGLAGQLAQAGEQFCIETASGRPTVIAGYHWFDDWGRDTLISLPGLTFHAGREDFGLRVMAELARHIRDGLVPNMFSESGDHAYNSVDASLWYAFALQHLLVAIPDGLAWVRQHEHGMRVQQRSCRCLAAAGL